MNSLFPCEKKLWYIQTKNENKKKVQVLHLLTILKLHMLDKNELELQTMLMKNQLKYAVI